MRFKRHNIPNPMVKLTRNFAFFLFLLMNVPAMAGHVTLSSQWDGSEDLTAPFPGACIGAGELAYRQFNAVQVSISGQYHLADASDALPGNLVVALYRDSFDPENPGLNRVGVFDQGEPLAMDSGQDYRVVVQHWCSNIFPATFAVSMAGPGDISGADVVVSPDWSMGQLDGSEPTAVFSGVSQKYDVSGPVVASATGNYWFADVSVFDRMDLVIRVYQGAFNPANTSAGLVARLDDFGDLLLEAGKTYRFVVTAYVPGSTGEWHWVLFPPGPLGFNAGLNGAWYNPATEGQGILLDIFTETKLVFFAWFTFDLERPAGAMGTIGDEGQRWFTVSGNYEEGDNSASLTLYNSTGGVFDTSPPPVATTEYGTVDLHFTDCLNGVMTYNIPAGPVSGVIPLTRIAKDHLSLCATLGSPDPGVITE